MKKDKWHEYWQKRAVKAEGVLTQIHTLADVNGYARVEELIDAYFQSVAAGEVKDTPSPAAKEME